MGIAASASWPCKWPEREPGHARLGCRSMSLVCVTAWRGPESCDFLASISSIDSVPLGIGHCERDPREGWMTDMPGPDTVETEFSEPRRGATSAAFDDQSSDPVDGDAIASADFGRAEADRGRAHPAGAREPADLFEE